MPQEPPDETGERILDAAMRTLMAYGVKRSSVEAIARAAGVSHMTVRRRWSRKDELVLAVVTREVQSLFARVDDQMRQAHSAEEKLIEAFTTLYWFISNHPLLRRELDIDPASILPALTTSGGPAIQIGTAYVTGHLQRMEIEDGVVIESPEQIAGLFVRLTQSLVLTPPDDPHLNTQEDVRNFARANLLPIFRFLTTA